MADFLRSLALNDDEHAKLTALGAATPMALLSLRKASRQAFDNYLGAERAEAISRQAESLLSDEERATLQQAVRSGGALGARMDPLPDKPKPE